jgi:hypothetical protein
LVGGAVSRSGGEEGDEGEEEEDGEADGEGEEGNDGSDIFEYFIGWDSPAAKNVESGAWVPFGVIDMEAGAVSEPGGFAEMNHGGILFADVGKKADDPPVVLLNINGDGDAKVVALALSRFA